MSFLHIGMAQVVEILSHVRQELTYVRILYLFNTMGANVLATQGAKASAAMIFTMLNRIHSVPAR